jgi:DNA-binding NtrC family response regulator
MTGVQLVDDLILQKPNLQVVLSSGYIGQKSRWAEIKNKGFIFLQKPYHISELLKAIK